ncbi:MAG: potassium transporter [Bacteroidetes bacterium]|nr:potassium transporter [Bacteroidota bacterium]
MLEKIKLNPWHYLIITFLALIIIGTILLKMPFVTHVQGLSFIDALFTATSAVCVTGLTVVNTSGFNPEGQWVLLLLMQLGAIGIMTLNTSFLLLISGRLDLKQQLSFSKLQDSISFKSSTGILKFILQITFITEFIGAVLLFVGFYQHGFEINEALYQAVFHSISAFCNAGFSTFDSSLIGFNSLIKYTIMALIIVGGAGYIVLFEMINKITKKQKLGLHSKIVVLTSFILIATGSVMIYFLEGDTVSVTDSLFQSVTARTAGFNTIDIGSFHSSTLLILMVLMFIGASPGSTGGGIKTTTFFVAIVSFIKVIRGDSSTVIFNKHITHTVILKAFSIIFMYIIIIILATVLLLYRYPQLQFHHLVFEVVSATGTVGLSVGISSEIASFGKIVLICCMFIGRIGPVSLAMIKSNKEFKPRILYPQEKINLG